MLYTQYKLSIATILLTSSRVSCIAFVHALVHLWVRVSFKVSKGYNKDIIIRHCWTTPPPEKNITDIAKQKGWAVQTAWSSTAIHHAITYSCAYRENVTPSPAETWWNWRQHINSCAAPIHGSHVLKLGRIHVYRNLLVAAAVHLWHNWFQRCTLKMSFCSAFTKQATRQHK